MMLQRIISFTVEMSGANRKKLNGKSRLFHDLGITGDDAVDFLNEFENKFEVDLIDFEFDKYFGPELPFNPFMYVYLLLFDREALHFEPVTLNDLVKAAEAKKWISSDHV